MVSDGGRHYELIVCAFAEHLKDMPQSGMVCLENSKLNTQCLKTCSCVDGANVQRFDR